MPCTGQIDYRNFKINCPRDDSRVNAVTVELVYIRDRYVVREFNGCDSRDGSRACRICIQSVSKLFWDHPDLEPHGILSLDLVEPV